MLVSASAAAAPSAPPSSSATLALSEHESRGFITAQQRTLQQTANVTEVTVVSSGEGLREAIQAGVEHIEVVEHLDITGMGWTPSIRGNGFSILGNLVNSVRSIRVRRCQCSTTLVGFLYLTSEKRALTNLRHTC